MTRHQGLHAVYCITVPCDVGPHCQPDLSIRWDTTVGPTAKREQQAAGQARGINKCTSTHSHWLSASWLHAWQYVWQHVERQTGENKQSSMQHEADITGFMPCIASLCHATLVPIAKLQSDQPRNGNSKRQVKQGAQASAHQDIRTGFQLLGCMLGSMFGSMLNDRQVKTNKAPCNTKPTSRASCHVLHRCAMRRWSPLPSYSRTNRETGTASGRSSKGPKQVHIKTFALVFSFLAACLAVCLAAC